MTKTVEIPGGTAVLKEKDELTNKEVKRITKAQYGAAGSVLRLQDEYGFDPENKDTWKQAVHMTPDEVDVLDLYQRACVKVRLVSWTIDLPIPEDEEAVDNLPLPIYEAIVEAAADINLLGDDKGNPTDPKVSTDNSSDSSTT